MKVIFNDELRICIGLGDDAEFISGVVLMKYKDDCAPPPP